MMIERAVDKREVKRLLQQFPVTAILGPRQSGKTTLAREFSADHYFDLENPRDLASLQNPQLTLEELQGLIVIDEIQRLPEIFPLIRFMVDHHQQQRYLILGSASGKLLRQSSESLAGRIAFHILEGFRIHDIQAGNFKRLWLRGGFPLSFTAETDDESRSWRDHYLTSFLERDLPQLGIMLPAQGMRRFLTMLAHFHGQVLNFSELARSFGISDMTARRHLEILEATLVVRLLHPWHVNLGKRLVKRPKIYFSDSGLFHALIGVRETIDLLSNPKLGASWEGFAQSCVLRSIGKGISEAYFWATHSGAELDLFWQERGKNWGAEFKINDAPMLTPSMKVAIDDLDLAHLWVIYPGKKAYKLDKLVSVIPLPEIAHPWKYPQ